MRANRKSRRKPSASILRQKKEDYAFSPGAGCVRRSGVIPKIVQYAPTLIA
jgi:hypothetical protein